MVAANAPLAKGVVSAVGGDHEAASGEGDGDLLPVTGEAVAQEGAGEDQGEARGHEDEDRRVFVAPVAGKDGRGAEERDEDGQDSMGALFGG